MGKKITEESVKAERRDRHVIYLFLTSIFASITSTVITVILVTRELDVAEKIEDQTIGDVLGWGSFLLGLF